MRGGPLVIIGDTLLDVDVDGSARRLSPDAPVPVVDCQQERQRAGGAGLAAVLAARLAGPDVRLVTALGDDWGGRRLRDLLGGEVDVLTMPLLGGTVRKIRVRAAGQSLVRLDSGDGRAGPGRVGREIEQALAAAGAILVCDYGRGMAAHPGLMVLLARLPRDIPVVWDPHPAGQPPVAGARLVTPNASEARGFAAALGVGAVGDQPGTPIAWAARDARYLARAWGTAVAVTMGADGALLSAGEAVPMLAPAAQLDGARPADSCGAGDCFAVAAAQALRAGGVLTEAVTEAVRAASEFVREGGAASSPGLTIPRPTAGPGRAAAAPAAETAARPGPGSSGAAWRTVADLRSRGGKIVATGGCFDLLHAGHVETLRTARRLGDGLVVCLNSDASVRALKGAGRPLVGQHDRARVLAALECVDAVIIFDELTPAALLDRLRPDIWVKGGDYARAELAEADVIGRHGGEVVLLPYVDRHSTSQLVAAAGAISASAAQNGDTDDR